jgi:hypothetical protein
VEKRHFLEHDAHLLPHGPDVEVADVPPVEAHFTELRMDHAGDELGDGGLAGSGRTDERNQLAAADLEADVVDRERRGRRVAIRDVMERDRSRDGARILEPRLFRRRGQHVIEPLQMLADHLQPGHGFQRGLQRLREERLQREKRGEDPQGHVPRYDRTPADPEHHRHRHTVDRGHELRDVRDDQAVFAGAIHGVDAAVAPPVEHRGLGPRAFDHLHHGEHLHERRRVVSGRGELRREHAIRLAACRYEDAGPHDPEGHDEQPEPEVVEQHQQRVAGQQKDVEQRGDRGAGEKVAKLGIALHPLQQIARSPLVEE